jgi:tetratricopeptide (TPR) repeat protein
MEDGPEDRAGPFEWLNNKLVDNIAEIPITARDDQGDDYSHLQQQDARRTGSESSCKDADGEIDTDRKRAFDAQLAAGHISADMFEKAIKATRRAAYEELSADFQQTYEEFQALEKVVDEKFGDVAPNLAQCRSTLNEIRQSVSDILARKRRDEPDPVPVTPGAEGNGVESGAGGANPMVMRIPLTLHDVAGSAANGSWQEAESLIRSGQVEKGLADMTRLAASETSGRNRFQRKLLLADICLGSGRERLARSILEELAEQIDKLQLEAWESSELISSVWTRLYRLYKRSGESDDSERGDKLYERLCRLDPWQALGCTE